MAKVNVRKVPGRTFSRQVEIVGNAPFSGKKVRAVFEPNYSGRVTIEYQGKLIIVAPESIKLNPGGHTSVISKGNTDILFVEHVFAVLNALGISSVCIRLYGDSQLPALDGSAEKLTKVLGCAGTKIIGRSVEVLEVAEEFEFSDDKTDSYAKFSPDGSLNVEVEINYSNIIGSQHFGQIVTKGSFLKSVCWARSFVRSPLDDDGEKWGRIRKLIPILPENPVDSPIIVYSDSEFLTPLRVSDEPARHKLLDFIGDIYMLGRRMKGRINVYKPGHYFNQKLVHYLGSLTGGYER